MDIALKPQVLRRGKVDIPPGKYQPTEIGIYLSDVESIQVDGICGICKAIPSWMHPAHAHPEENRKALWFYSGKYIYEDEGFVSDVFIHEYCHILRGTQGLGSWYGLTTTEIDAIAHDDAWAQWMMVFGLNPTPTVDYVP